MSSHHQRQTTTAPTPTPPPTERERELRQLAEQLTGPLWSKAGEMKHDHRDLKIVISANAETGVGKTSLAVFLAYALDCSPGGFDVTEQATLDIEEYRAAYDELEKGAALILDEAEQLDARRAMSQDDVDTAFEWQTKRIREISTILTLPTWGDLEKRLREMCDLRIEILRRGEALVHYRERDRYEQGGVFWQPVGTLTWPNMDDSPGFDRLEAMKEEFLEGMDGRALLDAEEAEERIKEETKELRQDKKQWQAKALYFGEGLDQQEVADELDVTQPRVSQWVNQ